MKAIILAIAMLPLITAFGLTSCASRPEPLFGKHQKQIGEILRERSANP
jgi:hypothetical protein